MVLINDGGASDEGKDAAFVPVSFAVPPPFPALQPEAADMAMAAAINNGNNLIFLMIVLISFCFFLLSHMTQPHPYPCIH